MCSPQLPGSSPARIGSTSTTPMTVETAPAVCRISPPMPSANRPSTVRYRPAPTTALLTPGSPNDTGAWLCMIAEPMKKMLNTTISLTTSISTANTTILAVSIGHRRGTASSEARMTPVPYSVVISSTPSTQMVSWPRLMPAPMMKLTGSAEIVASLVTWLGPEFQLAEISDVSSTSKPTVTATNAISVQTVERTERILVHSEASRRPKPLTPPAGAVPRAGALAGTGLVGAGAVTGRSRRAWRPGPGWPAHQADPPDRARRTPGCPPSVP